MTPFNFQRRGFLNYIATAFALGVVLVLWRSHFYENQDNQDQLLIDPDSRIHSEISKIIVVASLAKDNSTWLNTHFPDWETRRYIVDDNSTVPKNKGRESMV
jgi:hypothetical protein